MQEMMNQELNVVVMPNGSFQLEWADTQDAINKSSRLLQEEIYKQFSADAHSWLLFLGFCDHQVSLSPSLDYWRNFTGAFARRLCQTPDLEILRHKVKVLAEEDELRTHLERAPLMIGSEYLSMELLESVWSGLNDAFTLAIKSYGETVVGIVRRSRKGVNVASIREKAGFDDKQIRTYIYKAKRQGKIKNLKRGIYVSS